MIKVFCDGCDKRGVQTELTGTDYVRVPFLGRDARIMHLCKAFGCFAMYEQFERKHKQMTREHAERFRREIEKLMGELWEEVRSGSPETRPDEDPASVG